MPTNKYTPHKSSSRIVLERNRLRDSMNAPDSIEGGTEIGSGLLTAFQTLAISILFVMVPVLATSAVSTTLVDKDFDTGASLLFSLKTWVLAHGGGLNASGALISMVPFGLTFVLFMVSQLSVRRSLRPSFSSGLTYALSYVVVVLGVATLLGTSGLLLLRTFVITLLVAVCSTILGLRKRPDARYLRDSVSELLGRVPVWFRRALVGASAAAVFSFVIGAVTVIGWLYLGRDSMALVLNGWPLDALSNLAFVTVQILYLPNLISWALSWLAGPGFVIGAGTIISPSEVVLGPLPSIPLLGSLPQSTAPSGFSIVFALFVVIAGALGGWRAARSSASFKWWGFLAVPGCAFVPLWLVFLVVAWANSGEIGGGENFRFGLEVFSSSLSVAALLTVGIALGFAVVHPEIKDRLKALVSGGPAQKYSQEQEIDSSGGATQD